MSPEADPRSSAQENSPSAGAAPTRLMVEARAIVKRFGGNTILDGVSLAAAPGSVTAIIGASGSGLYGV